MIAFFRKITILFSRDFEKKYASLLKETDEQRKQLDARLTDIARATLNGEDKWFLQLAKDDPECVLNVVKECGNDSKDAK